MDNTHQGAPVIPAGTQPTVFGTASFPGQAPTVPTGQQPAPTVAQPVPQAAAAATTAFAELAAKKGFSGVDDLVKAYENLESQTKRVEMTMAELIKSREDITPPAAPSVVAEPVAAVPRTEQEALKIVENVARNVAKPLEERIALQELFIANPDAKEYASDMAKAVRANPGISWDAAYKLAKFDKIQAESFQKGQQQAQQTAQLKQGLQAGTSQPTGNAGRDVNTDIRNMIKDRSIPLSEITRIMKERLQ